MSSARRLKRSLQVAVLAAVCPALFAGASAAAPALAATGAHPVAVAGTWGNAKEVPGIEALNHGRSMIDQISCPSAGNCSAGGTYTDAGGTMQFFVVDETNGVWGSAEALPGSTVHNTNGLAFFDALSCASAGYCSGAGDFEPTSGRQRAWVATETNGVWGSAITVPGLSRLETGDQAVVRGLSCTAPGDCSAGGFYTDSGGIFHPFVINESNGTWHTAINVPGISTLTPLNTGEIQVLSCDSPGSCSAGGSFQIRNRLSLFTVSEKAGKWQPAIKLPGIDSLSKGAFPEFTHMSCTSAGNCSAGGHYGNNDRAFVVTETGGTWAAAQAVRGISITPQGFSDLDGLSCTSAGNCLAVGSYAAVIGQTQHAFAAFEKDGTWGSAKTIPGIAALNTGPGLSLEGVSCGAPGDCSTVGGYTDHQNHIQAFVASEVNGRWVTVQEVPGSAALNTGGNAVVWAVSCDAAGNCGAGGSYTVGNAFGPQEAFVVNQS